MQSNRSACALAAPLLTLYLLGCTSHQTVNVKWFDSKYAYRTAHDGVFTLKELLSTYKTYCANKDAAGARAIDSAARQLVAMGRSQ